MLLAKTPSTGTWLMTFVNEILNQMPHLAKPQQKFLALLFSTILILRGKVNFLNLSRYCHLSEKTFRRQFRKGFDFLSFNRIAIDTISNSSTRIVAFDTSFISKSGKKTFGLDYFFNSCASRAERGLELSMASIVDVDENTAYTLSVLQTEPSNRPSTKRSKRCETRMDFYLKHFIQLRPALPLDVKYAAVDGYFAKKKFVDGVCALSLEVVSKLRCDANLRYIYTGEQKKRGRRRLYDGKVRFTDLRRFQKLGQIEDNIWLYTKELYHVSLQRRIRVVVVVKQEQKARPRVAVLMSTDTDQCGKQIYRYYKARFQIEFQFRDAKQYAGLEDCQARDREALHYHFNATMAVVNLTKIESMQNRQAEKAKVFSMWSWKQRYFNEHFLEMIISKLEIEPSLIKNHPQYEFLRNYAAIAA